MTIEQWKQLLVISLMSAVILVCSSCDRRSANSGTGGGDIERNSTHNDDADQLAGAEPNQSDLPADLQAADQSPMTNFSDLKIDGEFTFDSQRLVDIVIEFSQPQQFARLSFFASFDEDGISPITLLEQAQLMDSNAYNSSMIIASDIQSLVLVVEADFYIEIELAIDSNHRVSYRFE